MNEEIISYLREHPQGVSSQSLAQQFLKFKNPDSSLAHTAITAILKNDSRCFVDNKKQWHATVKKKKGTPILELPFTVVYCLCDSTRRSNKILYISIWDVIPEQQSTMSAWLIDSTNIKENESYVLSEESKSMNETICLKEIACQINSKLENRIPVFLSSSDCSSISNFLGKYGFYLTDDTFLVSELFKLCDLSIPRPLTLEAFLEALHIQEIAPEEVRKAANLMASGVFDLIQRIVEKGIETREEMEENFSKDYSVYFSGKEFSEKTIQGLPTTPGVYGFRNKDGNFIYIGKAKNLRRRLMGYFRYTDESPHKIEQIRNDSYSLITYQCGSELEALLYEYRLIQKHTPTLNSKIDIAEREGTYSPVNDCIILLPHAKDEMLMSFWIRENQKIMMKAIECNNFNESIYCNEIEKYFFCEKLPKEFTDFPEMELATRWIKNHRDNLQVIEVNNYADAKETVQFLSISIKDIQRNINMLQ